MIRLKSTPPNNHYEFRCLKSTKEKQVHITNRNSLVPPTTNIIVSLHTYNCAGLSQNVLHTPRLNYTMVSALQFMSNIGTQLNVC